MNNFISERINLGSCIVDFFSKSYELGEKLFQFFYSRFFFSITR